jgi:NADPH-dependent 2,4-dienoyl-CoA reductase/sulfur reductase-like enzyme
LRISRVIDFLTTVQTEEGDLELQSITGFWVRSIPATGERVVVCAVGDAKSIEDLLKH